MSKSNIATDAINEAKKKSWRHRRRQRPLLRRRWQAGFRNGVRPSGERETGRRAIGQGTGRADYQSRVFACRATATRPATNPRILPHSG